jgi:hypothetical protein
MDNNKIKSKKKRNLIYLLNSIIQLIPANSAEFQFKEDLEKVRDRASYTDPDVMYFMWEDAQSIITNKFKNMETMPEWCVQFINLWTDKVDM